MIKLQKLNNKIKILIKIKLIQNLNINNNIKSQKSFREILQEQNKKKKIKFFNKKF